MRRIIIVAALSLLPVAASAQVAQTAEAAMAAATASGVCPGGVLGARWEAGRVIATCAVVGAQAGGLAPGTAAVAAGVGVAAAAALLAGGSSSTTTTTTPAN